MDEERNVLWFNEINIKDIPRVGGKGASLGEMTINNFPVPGGFVVTAQAYFKFIREKKLEETIVEKIDSIDVENTEQLKKVTKEVRDLITRTDVPAALQTEIMSNYRKLGERKRIGLFTAQYEVYVAVRSSATAEDLPDASFAGQQETYLNIKGSENLLKSVRKCWASLFTARAVYYRKKQGFDTRSVGLAAVIQKMAQSEASGVMFTVDPAGEKENIIIEAGFGLGETVVSGSITPDNYVINKKDFLIKNKKINNQEWMLTKKGAANEKVFLKEKSKLQKLDDAKIIELAKIGARIEQHYEKPMDIEWAMENNKLFIVQARPVTAISEEKGEDLEGNKLLEGLSGAPGVASGKVKIVPSIEDISKVQTGDILVTKMTSPSWVPVMKKAKAIITNEGGRTCHAAIVSRELGIPSVVGTGDGTEKLTDDQVVTVDGYHGLVYEGEVAVKNEEEKIVVIDEKEIDDLEKKLIENTKQLDLEEKELVNEIEQKYASVDYDKMSTEEKENEQKQLLKLLRELSIKVKVNVALPDVAEKAMATGADGVGLLRAEHMITSSGKHPAEFIRRGEDEELKDVVKRGIKTVAEKFPGKPVWFRTFDARTDEFKELEGGEKEDEEDNPMLGWHGIRRDVDDPRMLKAQFKAIKELHSEGLNKVGVMLPFVQSIEEVISAKKIAEEVGLQKEVDFGVMIETPASIWIIEDFIPYIKFISFGTNDLTQLTLGLDRNNERVQKQFNELHPAILKSINRVIRKCKAAGVTTSVCGQAASNPEMVKKLVWMGIDSVSANIDAVDKIRKVVMKEEKKHLLELNQNL